MAGCDDCCGRTFSVFRVEAKNLLAGFKLLGEDKRRTILRKCAEEGVSVSACVLLENGRCMLYEYRPIICRTHGMPITSRHITLNGATTTSTCPKNFRSPGSLERLPATYILDLDTLNKMLTVINMLYMKELRETGLCDIQERTLIPDIFTE